MVFKNFSITESFLLGALVYCVYLGITGAYDWAALNNTEETYIEPLKPCLETINKAQSEISWEEVSREIEQVVTCFQGKKLNSVSQEQLSKLSALNEELSSSLDKSTLDRSTLNTNLADIVREIEWQGTEESQEDKKNILLSKILVAITLGSFAFMIWQYSHRVGLF